MLKDFRIVVAYDSVAFELSDTSQSKKERWGRKEGKEERKQKDNGGKTTLVVLFF